MKFIENIVKPAGTVFGTYGTEQTGLRIRNILSDHNFKKIEVVLINEIINSGTYIFIINGTR